LKGYGLNPLNSATRYRNPATRYILILPVSTLESRRRKAEEEATSSALKARRDVNQPVIYGWTVNRPESKSFDFFNCSLRDSADLKSRDVEDRYTFYDCLRRLRKSERVAFRYVNLRPVHASTSATTLGTELETVAVVTDWETTCAI
jgi:hypothetical protein